MSEADFLLNLDRQFGEFSDSVVVLEAKTSGDRRLNMLKMSVAAMCYEVIHFYFRSTGISTDANIMTTSEIQVVIDKINNIMDTYLRVDL